MSLWPRSLGVRIVAALLLASGGIVALGFAVQAREQPASSASAPAASAAGVPTESFEVQRLRVAFVGGPILLALRPASLEPQVAPVVQVLGDGGLALRRPAPRAEGPSVAAESAVRTAAIVVPGNGLGGLDPRARSALVEVIGQLVQERPVPAARFRTVDFALSVAELERLLQWVP